MVRTAILLVGHFGLLGCASLLGCGEAFEAGALGGGGTGATVGLAGAAPGGAHSGGAASGGAAHGGAGGASQTTSSGLGGGGGAVPAGPTWIDTKSQEGKLGAPPTVTVDCAADDLLLFSAVTDRANSSPTLLASSCSAWQYLEAVSAGTMTASLYGCRSVTGGMVSVTPTFAGDPTADVFTALTVVRGAGNPPALDAAVGGAIQAGTLWVDFDGLRPEGALLMAFIALFAPNLQPVAPSDLVYGDTQVFAVNGTLNFGIFTRRVVEPQVDDVIAATVDASTQRVAHGIVLY